MKKELDNEKTKLKNEVAEWMEKHDKKRITWENRGITSKSCNNYKRVTAKDILLIVKKNYDTTTLHRVCRELEKLHSQRYNKYDLKIEKS